MGDFNCIRKKEDREGGIYNNKDTVWFNSFFNETCLIELEGGDYKLKWFSPYNKKSKLDRVIVNT